MNRLIRRAAILACLCLPILPAEAQEPPLTEAQANAMRALVRQTLIENPEILAEAMQALQVKRAEETRAAQQAAIRDRAADMVHADDPFLGPKTAKVAVVEFFDYNCGYCRAAFPDLQATLKAHPDTRIVVKDLPVLGPDSVAVSRLALAARSQGKYAEYHAALMTTRARLDETSALAIAKDLKLDVARLKKDAAGKAVEETLGRNHALAEDLGITGTPSFVIGDALFPGKIGPDVLSQAIAEAKTVKK
jgi:protein-disulfide isomerase